MTTKETTNSSTLPFQATGFSWDEYVAYRPAYPQSFFTRLTTHHKTHSRLPFKTLHDVGAGPGIATSTLAPTFTHLIVSDPNPTYTSLARTRLSSLPYPEGKFTFLTEPAERSSVETGSIDCLVICEALHWCDLSLAIASFARQLKSGGTFAQVMYSPPVIVGNEEAQRIWWEMFG